MSVSPYPVPEPVLPEHQLLADAAPEIELSADFRAKVLKECAASRVLAQKVFAAKVIAAILAILLAGTVTYSMWNAEATVQPQQPQWPTEVPEAQPTSSPDFPSLSPE